MIGSDAIIQLTYIEVSSFKDKHTCNFSVAMLPVPSYPIIVNLAPG